VNAVSHNCRTAPVIEETAPVESCLACGTTMERGGCPQCLGDLFPKSGAPRSAVRPMSLPVPTVNHPLHIAATILTGGLWLVVYIPIVVRQRRALRA
jgi:hypothetical protein